METKIDLTEGKTAILFEMRNAPVTKQECTMILLFQIFSLFPRKFQKKRKISK